MGQLVIGHSGKRWLMENENGLMNDTDSNESVCTESEWFTSTQGSVRRSGDVTGTALLCLYFPELIYSGLTVNGGQYGAGASINGGRPRGADDAICSAYYQGRADTAPSVPSAPSLPALGLIFKTLHHKRLYHVSYRRCYNYFRFILTDVTYLCGAWTLPIACRLAFATLGRIK